MSPNMKLSMLAFVGAAVAIPQYGHGHGNGHKHPTPSAGVPAYPSGGWGNFNSTSVSAVAAGTGSSSAPAGEMSSYPVGEKSSYPVGEKSSYPVGGKSSYPVGEQTTYVDMESTITSTTTRTVYMTVDTKSAAPTDVNVNDVGVNDMTSKPAVCGETVYVTATEKVTVTVPAGGASPPTTPEASSPAPEFSGSGYESPPFVPSSSAAPMPSAPAGGYEAAEPSKEEVKPTPAPPAPIEGSYSAAPTPSVEVPSTPEPSSSPVESSSAPASSPSSPPTSSPGYSGGKRGLAYRWDGAADCKSFENNNFGFVWDWEADTKGDIGKLTDKFIPTLRTMENTGDWAEKVEAAISAGSKVVFGFNEPDIASQANMGVAALCDAWKTYMNPIAKKHSDVTIVGPSVSSSDNAGQGLDYLGQFVKQCPGAQFHDINIHWYGPATAGFDAFKAHFEKATSQFSGKKVWVTEFGLTGSTAQESADFLKQAQEYLDGNDACAGYSYFAVGHWDASANLLGTASDLTETGKVYVN